MASDRDRRSISWTAIILWLIFFFPVGLVLLVKKMTSEQMNLSENGKSLKVLGWVFVGIGCLYAIGAIGDRGTLFLTVLFLVLGVLCLQKGKQYAQRAQRYERYVSIVITGGTTDIDNIAAAYPTDYNTALRELNEMLQAGYFPGAYMDSTHRRLILRDSAQGATEGNSQTSSTGSAPRVIRCPNCGASNTVVPGTVVECEYCGSPLK